MEERDPPQLPPLPRHVVAVLLICWAAFCWGALGHYLALRQEGFDAGLIVLLILAPPAALAATLALRRDWARRTRFLAEELRRHTAAIDAWDKARLRWAIALAAGLGLYAELALIRLHASHFQLFAYFKNVSLLSCFLGLGLGYALSARRPLSTPLALPLIASQLVFTTLLKGWSDSPFLQNPIPERFSLGMYSAQSLNAFAAVFGFIGLVFAWNALCFVPFGQLAGRLMGRLGKLEAYSWNLLGSLAGIVLFNVVSLLWAPPVVWILLVTLLALPFVAGSRRALAWTAVAAVMMLAMLGWHQRLDAFDLYSPYQKLTVALKRGAPPEVQVSNVYYQRMLDLRPESVENDEELAHALSYYSLPYRFKPAAERVLIVGSGTGNDVAAALRHGVAKVDAVEIDPVILELGRRFHPENPYASDRVRAVNDDARSYLRRPGGTYDLVVYGLLDSHTLLSGVSSVRLDSFVYTVEGIRQARERLAPGGSICMTFSAAHPLLARKIFLMLEEAFDGETPRVLHSRYDFGISFLIGDGVASRPLPEGVPFEDLTPLIAGREDLRADVSTDDWPFFYMPVRRYPFSYLAMVVFLTLVSALFVLRLAPGARAGFSAPCFFLGAGFMLVETKGITELALVYGSTWMVIGTVIAAILVMAYLANLAVLYGKAPPRGVTYALLLASLALGLTAVSWNLDGLSVVTVRILLTAVLTLPLFFSGLAFSREIERTGTVAGAMASNLLGAMLGGFLEYNSMYFGFRSLYFLAMVTYVLAMVRRRE